MYQTSNLERRLASTAGLKGLKNQFISDGVIYILRRIKNNLGINMTFTDRGQIRTVLKWIEKKDKNFKNHISNPYMIGSKIANTDPIIEGSFIIKLNKATYAFISGELVERQSSDPTNTISMYIFGKMAKKYFRHLSRYIEKNNTSNDMMYSIAGRSNNGNDRDYWTCTGTTLQPRSMDTLFFDNGVKESVINHLQKWLNNEHIYTERGLIYKTGILLYGTPGTGKSSLATAIATYLHCGLVTIDCTTFQYLPIAEVTESINADDDRYVVLLDEIDAIFGSRENEDDDEKNKRISKLLAFLDSQQSPNNVVFVATTNYIDRLDKAALRKGRFDLLLELDGINRHAATAMCKSFNLSQEKTNEILCKASYPINPSSLQSSILNALENRG